MNSPLTVVGQINLVKIVVVPKFLYLFQNNSLSFIETFLHSPEKCISSFMWNSRSQWNKRSALQRSKDIAGLALPNWSCNIKAMLDTGLEYACSSLNFCSLILKGYEISFWFICGWQVWIVCATLPVIQIAKSNLDSDIFKLEILSKKMLRPFQTFRQATLLITFSHCPRHHMMISRILL